MSLFWICSKKILRYAQNDKKSITILLEYRRVRPLCRTVCAEGTPCLFRAAHGAAPTVPRNICYLLSVQYYLLSEKTAGDHTRSPAFDLIVFIQIL